MTFFAKIKELAIDRKKFMNQLIDRFGRKITYLRIAVTNRCNLACVYCVGNNQKLPAPARALSLSQLLAVVRTAAKLGIDTVRITGGEPLLRKDIVQIVRKISQLGMKVGLTTNGTLLKPLAKKLFRAGLQQINVSLDTLNPETYHRLTRRDQIKDVLAGLKAAQSAGFRKIRLNVVVRRDNVKEIPRLLEFAAKNNFILKLIELMPFAGNKKYLSLARIEKKLVKDYRLVPRTPKGNWPNPGPAHYYRYKKTFVGFVTARSRPFCQHCNRLRLEYDGKLRSCLGYPIKVDLGEILAAGSEKKELAELFYLAAKLKPARHNFYSAYECQTMRDIGG